MTISEQIYRLRTARSMSQEDLADRLDVSRQSISKWETNAATPELEKLIRLCTLFGVSLDYLTGLDTTQASAPQTLSPSPATPSQNHLTAQHIIGSILLAASLFGSVLLYIFADIGVAIVFALPLLLCGIICIALKQRAGYFCAWGLFLCFDLVTFSLVSFQALPALVPARILFLIGLLLATFHSYRTVTIRVSRYRLVLLLLGWGVWATIVAGILVLSILSTSIIVQNPGGLISAIRPNYGMLMLINLVLSTPAVPLIFFSVRFWQVKKKECGK